MSGLRAPVLLIARSAAGESVALVSDAGTPVVSDPERIWWRQLMRQVSGSSRFPGLQPPWRRCPHQASQAEQFLFAWDSHQLSQKTRKLWFQLSRRAGCDDDRL